MSQNHTSNQREAKKAQFAAGDRDKKNRKFLVAAGIALAVIAGALGVSGLVGGADRGTSATKARVEQRTRSLVENRVVVPIADVNDGKAKFLDYTTADNKTVRFFVIKSSDGEYRAAVDACDVCYRAKMGYYQQGDDMVCKKCGRHFPSNLVNEVSGGCNPIGLPRIVEGGNLIIQASELESRKTYF